MHISRKSNRFSSVVHLGLFAIVVLLLCLNLASNAIIYHVWRMHQRQTFTEMNRTAVEISRKVEFGDAPALSKSMTDQLKQSFGLEILVVFPSVPESDDRNGRWQWYLAMAKRLEAAEIPRLTPIVLKAHPNELVAGYDDDEYFLTHVFSGENGRNLLILSKKHPTLSYLDATSKRMLYFNIIALVIVVGLYSYLWRFIMAPFKKMQLASEEAGRNTERSPDDVEGVVNEYRTMIDELREKESRLVQMNELISARADQLESFNAHLLTSMNSGVISVDAGGKIDFCNPAGSSILELEAGRLLGLSIDDELPIDQKIIGSLRTALTGRSSTDYVELEIKGASGILRTVGMTITAIFNGQREFMGLTAILVDTTEINQLRSSLEIRERMSALGEMAGGLAHQLRNSIGAMLGFNRLVQKKLVGQSVSAEWPDAVESEGLEAKELIEKFLSFSRPFDFTAFRENLSEIVSEIVETSKASSGADSIMFETKIPNDMSLDCDRLLLKQALSNLVDNAVAAYRGKSGRVKIDAEFTPDGGIQIRVRDEAGGIDESLRPKIFTPFVSSRPGGSGLGLPLSARIIDLHGGSISLANSARGCTEFIITLPTTAPTRTNRSLESTHS